MLARIHNLGGNLAFIQPVNPMDPGFGTGGGSVDPGYGMGVHPHPGHELPHLPGIPDNSLPTTPPPYVGNTAGLVVVLARDPMGVWHWATIPTSVTPSPLPVPPPATAAPKV